MIFNLEKNNNRTFGDWGDLEASLLKVSLTNKELDRKTVASVIGLLNYITKVFNEKQPKNNTVYPITIQDAFLNKEINRVLKKNAKLDKKKENSLLGLDDESEVLLPVFTTEQVAQLQELINVQNEALKKIYAEAVKNITINVEAPQQPPKKTTT